MTRRPPAAAVPEKQKPQKSRYGLIVALMAIFILAGAGYFAYPWWSSRSAAPAPAIAPVATSPRAAPSTEPATAAPEPPPTTTIVPTPAVPAPTAEAVSPPRAPQAAATPGGARARYDAMAREYAANPTGNFAVQFAIVCEPANVTKALRGSGGGEVWFIPITLGGRSCYRMFWGRFATREEAERGMARMPNEYRESRAAVVTIPR